jgi:MarR family transcriptional regulator, organic hydroperoxide resistance regulator
VQASQKPLVKYLVRAGELAVDDLEADLAQGRLKGLAASHLEIITFLLRKGPTSMQELARALERDKSTVTVLVRKLGELGFIARKGLPTDGRVTIVSLTAKGAALRTPVLRVFVKTERALAKNLSPEERENLFVLLGKVYSGLKDQKR